MSLPPAYFDAVYAGDDDPWGFAARWYEHRKRALTLAALPDAHYHNAFEPGCSVGMLTEGLAERCDRLLATDPAERALQVARARLRGHPGVHFAQMSVPREWPVGEQFDLVVLSELGYYLDPTELALLAARTADVLTPHGIVVACHWRHQVADFPVSGDVVHTALSAQPGLALLARYEEEDFRLDVLTPPPLEPVSGRPELIW